MSNPKLPNYKILKYEYSIVKEDIEEISTLYCDILRKHWYNLENLFQWFLTFTPEQLRVIGIVVVDTKEFTKICTIRDGIYLMKKMKQGPSNVELL